MPHDAETPNLSVVAGSLDDPPLASGPIGPDGPPPDGPPDAPPPEEGGRKPGEIFPGSTVTPLGVSGKMFCYLDCLNQLGEVDNHTRDRIRGLFGGRADYLETAFPRWSKGTDKDPPKIIGWNHEQAASAMQRACADRGVWSSRERLRGPGAWPDGHGGVILHCGDRILMRGPRGGDDWRVPGLIGDHVYPAGVPGPRPAECDGDAGRKAAAELLAGIKDWRWQRGEVDAMLLFGWIVAAAFGGALDWRPVGWITGDPGTGKSTLQKLIRAVMGGEQGLVTATDATEAGLRQVVMHATVAVALDEAEAAEDNRRMLAVIKLARQAASGGLVLRGGADHKGAEFRVRSMFLFSSVLVPPMLAQDLSRLALFELLPFEAGDIAPKIDEGHWAAVGRRIRRMVWRAWPRLHETLEGYRVALAAAGHSARGCDQYGTLLALADLALHGGQPMGDEMAGWAARLKADDVSSQMDEAADWERMLAHLFSQILDSYRSGSRYTVGELIATAAELPHNDTGFSRKEAMVLLRRAGIGVVGVGENASVEIANQHSGLAPLFRDTHWAAGVHRQAVKRVPEAEAPKTPRTFARAASRCWVFPLASIPWFFDDPAAERGTADAEDALETL